MANNAVMTMDDMYREMGIDTDALGCIMLKTEPLKVSDVVAEDELYYAADPNKYWIQGIVSEDVPHCTLLWGLMESGQTWKKYVDVLLEGWSLGSVTIDQVTFFESAYEDEQYFCIIAKLVVSPELLDANARLRKLPHLDSFPDYTPHLTLAYIKHDEALRGEVVNALNNRFLGEKIATKGLDYGR